MQIILTKQKSDGRWYGLIPDSDDGNGNEMDACWDNPHDTLQCLLDQLKENE